MWRCIVPIRQDVDLSNWYDYSMVEICSAKVRFFRLLRALYILISFQQNGKLWETQAPWPHVQVLAEFADCDTRCVYLLYQMWPNSRTAPMPYMWKFAHLIRESRPEFAITRAFHSASMQAIFSGLLFISLLCIYRFLSITGVFEVYNFSRLLWL